MYWYYKQLVRHENLSDSVYGMLGKDIKVRECDMCLSFKASAEVPVMLKPLCSDRHAGVRWTADKEVVRTIDVNFQCMYMDQQNNKVSDVQQILKELIPGFSSYDKYFGGHYKM